MAKIKGNFPGLSGKLGEIVFRTRNSGTFISRAPAKGILRMDEKSVMLRQKFVLSEKISAAVRKIPNLLMLWSKKKKIFKQVYRQIQFVSSDKGKYALVDISDVSIVPASDFMFIVNSCNYEDGNFLISAVIPAAGCTIAKAIEVYVSMHAALLMFNDTDDLAKRYEYFSLSSAERTCATGEDLQFVLKLSDVQQQQLSRCSSYSLLTVLVTTDKNKTPIKASTTILLK